MESHGCFKDLDQTALAEALKLHRKACALGWLRRRWGFLFGKDFQLVDLNSITEKKLLLGWGYAGYQEVSIDRIIGSERHSDEFDEAFSPLPPHETERWLYIAVRLLRKEQVPPIEVIQVGSRYFAQSGLYRISVERAMGKKTIKAYVTYWDIT